MVRLILIALPIWFCNSTWAADMEVEHAGALKNFMHKGDLMHHYVRKKPGNSLFLR